jgi:hypothetical protein
MNTRMISILAVGLLSASAAMASQARQSVMGNQDPAGVLGGGSYGSFYYDDRNNMFYNPAYINDFKNWAAIEKTNGANGANGGFVNNFGMVNVGFWFNRANTWRGLNDINTANNTGATTLNSVGYNANTMGALTSGNDINSATTGNNYRPWELMIGGDMGVKWGLGMEMLTYKGRKIDSQEDSINDIVLKAGVSVMDIEPFLEYKIAGKLKDYGNPVNYVQSLGLTGTTNGVGIGNATQVEAESKSFTAGVRYRFGEWTPFAAYRNDSFTIKTPADVVAVRRAKAFGFGTGRSMKAGEGTMLNYGLSFWRLVDGTAQAGHPTYNTAATTGVAQAAPTTAAQAGRGGNSTSYMPISVAIETDATSWLMLRAGLTHYIVAQDAYGSLAQATSGRMGAGLKLGKATLDWAIGSLASTSAAGATNLDGQTFDFSNGLFTNASLSYNW